MPLAKISPAIILRFLIFLILLSPSITHAENPPAHETQTNSTSELAEIESSAEISNDITESEETIPVTSVLVSEPMIDSVTEKPLSVQMTPPRVLTMVEEEGEQSYGYQAFGYQSTDKKYGYPIEGNTGKSSTRSFGYEPKDKTSFGYSDEGNTSVGKSGFGEKGYGYEGEANTYGRKDEDFR